MRIKLLVVGLSAALTMAGNASTNLLSHGDFNTWGVWTNSWTTWYTNSFGWITQETITPASGLEGVYDGTLQISMGNHDDNSSRGIFQTVAGSAGEEYTLSLQAGAQNWWRPNGSAYLVFLDATDSELASHEIDTTADFNNWDVGVAYQDFSIAAVAPAGATQVRVELAELNGSGTVWFDNVALENTTDDDGDCLPNYWEIENSLDPNDDGTTNIINGAIGDPDTDLLVNSKEYLIGTDPWDPDSDDDGLTDGFEVTFSNAPNPLVWDTDGDGLGDGAEVTNYFTNPLLLDTDGDGLWDSDEIFNTLTDPLLFDTDGDGENDAIEIFQGTNPTNSASSSAAFGWIIMDGTRDALYGDAVATQTVNTAWGDNADELDAAYAYVQKNRLFLMIAGNLNVNWNKYEIFIDATDAVTSNVLDAPSNDGADFMDGMTFDAGFSPDYYLNVRRGNGYLFNLDMAQLGTSNVSEHNNVFYNSMEGFANTGTGNANALPIGIAYDNSNTNGLVWGTNAVNVADVLAVTNGLELSIALSDIGNPGLVRIAVILNGANHDWISNQILGGLMPDQGALGRDGLGGDGGGALTNDLSAIDFNNFAGDQFFTVKLPLPVPEIQAIQPVSGNTEMQLDVNGLLPRGTYKLQESGNLVVGSFADVAGSEFTATNTSEVIVVPATSPAMFYQVVAP